MPPTLRVDGQLCLVPTVISPPFSEEKSVWELEAELKGHNNWVRDVAWAPDTGFTTSTIASCGHDGKVIIWQCKDLDKGAWDFKVCSNCIIVGIF